VPLFSNWCKKTQAPQMSNQLLSLTLVARDCTCVAKENRAQPFESRLSFQYLLEEEASFPKQLDIVVKLPSNFHVRPGKNSLDKNTQTFNLNCAKMEVLVGKFVTS
jgi:hypothetical protein